MFSQGVTSIIELTHKYPQYKQIWNAFFKFTAPSGLVPSL